MEKTAMQELIETLENFRGEIREKYDDDPLVIRGVTISIAEAKKLLTKERQQIIDAWRMGDNDSGVHPKDLDKQASDYYNQKYGQ